MSRFLAKHWLELVLVAACCTLIGQFALGEAGLAQVLAAARNWMWPIIWAAHLALIGLLIWLGR